MTAPKRLRRQGSAPPDSTMALRRRLLADDAQGKLENSEFYAKWLVEQNPTLGLLPARRIVSRELKPYRTSAEKSD